MPSSLIQSVNVNSPARLYASFAALLAVLLALVAFAYFNFRRLIEADRLNVHTYQVLLEAHQLSESLTGIDFAVRGFLINRDETVVQNYDESLRQFERHLAAAKALTADRAIQQERLEVLREKKDAWITEQIEPLIAVCRRTRNTSEAVLIWARTALKRRATLAEMRGIIDAIETTENGLLAERASEQHIFQNRTGWTLVGGALFSIALTLLLSSIVARNARVVAIASRQIAEEVVERRHMQAQLTQTIGALSAANIQLERLNDEFERTNLDLKRSNDELEQFAYVASHDLQEPLRAVSGCVQVLQRRYGGQLDARADEFIRHAVEGASRMQNLIHDLLAFSRVGSHGKPFEPVDMSALLRRAQSNVGVALNESGGQITHDDLPTIVADGGQIEQVMQNLLSNALKFRGQNTPQIHVGATRDEAEGAWIFSVSDNGPGIEARYFERIFIMFQRLHTRTDYPGTGIGLAICKKIIERHGGHIRVESTVGQGTTFFFSIPDGIQAPVEPGSVATPVSPNGNSSDAVFTASGTL